MQQCRENEQRLDHYKKLDDVSISTSGSLNFEEKAIELEALVSGLKSQLQMKQEDLEDLRNQKEYLEVELSDAKSQLSSARAQARNVQLAMEEYKQVKEDMTQYPDVKVHNLESQVSSLKAQVSKLTEESKRTAEKLHQEKSRNLELDSDFMVSQK